MNQILEARSFLVRSHKWYWTLSFALVCAIGSMAGPTLICAQPPGNPYGGGAGGYGSANADVAVPAQLSTQNPFGDSGMPEPYDFRGLIRVTYEVRVDGVVLRTSSMAGLMLATEPTVIVTCESILTADARKLDYPADAERLFKVETVQGMNPPSNYGGGYGGAGGGYGGMGGGLPQQMYISAEASGGYTVVNGLLFLQSKNQISSTLFLDADLDRRKATTDVDVFRLGPNDVVPQQLEGDNADLAPEDGLIEASTAGILRYKCNQVWLDRTEIITRFLTARKLQKGIGDGAEVAARWNGAYNKNDDLFGSSDVTNGSAAAQAAERNTNTKRRESNALLEAKVPLLVELKQATDETTKAELIEKLRKALADEFDAQHAVKTLELKALRERLEKLEKDEAELLGQRERVLQERLDLLIK